MKAMGCRSNSRSDVLPEEEADREALSLLVGAGAGLQGEDTSELAQHPRAGRRQPLQVLLWSTRHGGWLLLERNTK